MKAKVTLRKPTRTFTVAEQEYSLRALDMSVAEIQFWQAISEGTVGGDTASSLPSPKIQKRSYIVYDAASAFTVYVEGTRQNVRRTTSEDTSPKFDQLYTEEGEVKFSHASGSACNTNQYALRV